MEKIKIKVDIFHKIDYDKPFTFAQIKDIIQDDDVIHAGYDEGFYSENNSIDGHYFMTVTRERLENDAEFEKRKVKAQELKKELRERRYETYLKFKKEFEPEADPHEDTDTRTKGQKLMDNMEMENFGLRPLRKAPDDANEDPKE